MEFIKDESVQSWIFRTLVVNGESNFASLIGVNGMWHKRPIAPSRATLNQIKDLELLRFFRQSGIGIKKAGLFDNPTKYTLEIHTSKHLDLVTNQRKGHISIAYCASCIRESIKTKGFGYLKSEWLYGENCTVHGVDLKILNSDTRDSSEFLLKQILRGKSVETGLQNTENVQYLERYQIVEPEYHVMPCAIREFFEVASSSRNSHFPSGLHWDFYYADGRKKQIAVDSLHFWFKKYLVQYNADFQQFINDRLEIREYRFGLLKKNTLSEKLLKNKKTNCSKCYKWDYTDYCPIKPIKMQFVCTRSLANIKDIENQCDSTMKYRRPWI